MIIKDLLKQLQYNKFVGKESTVISEIISFNEINSNPNAIMWLNNKNIHKINNLISGTVICEYSDLIEIKDSCNYIFVSKPRLVFNHVIQILYPHKRNIGISQTAIIHPSASVSSTAYIGNYVTIEAGCVVGDHSCIGHNTVLLEGSIVGSNVEIGCNCVIGGVGFGYERDNDGTFIQIRHIGNVVVEDHVEIGSNTCVDRAVLGSTVLKTNCKIDNLVHIAHGAVIGRNSLVIAHAMIAGSTIVGDNVWVAPGSLLINKIVVSNNTTIGMGAVVLKSIVDENEVVVGNPAKSIKNK